MIQGGTFPYVEYLNIHANISQDPCVDPDNATDAGTEDLVLNQDLVNSRLAEVCFFLLNEGFKGQKVKLFSF